jgi:hypothetical protein
MRALLCFADESTVLFDDDGTSVLLVGDSTSVLLADASIGVLIVDESKVMYFRMRALLCFYDESTCFYLVTTLACSVKMRALLCFADESTVLFYDDSTRACFLMMTALEC